jgi:hypothetical protein
VTDKAPVSRRGNWPPLVRDYSWPPLQPGKTIRLRHGARSSRFADPLARAFVKALLEERPDLKAYPELVLAWGHAEARVELIRMWYAKEGFLNADGSIRGPADQLTRFEGSAARLRTELGLTPLSDAQLQKTRAEATHTVIDLEAIRTRGREAWARRQARELEDAVDAEVVE